MQVILKAGQRPKQKPQRRISASSSTKIVSIGEKWTDFDPEDHSPVAYPVSEKLINPLRHGVSLRKDDGAIEFQRWSDEKWKMARGGGQKKRYQCCADSSEENFYFWVFEGHSGRNLVDPLRKDNVLIPNDVFEYIYHVGCVINFFYHQIRIDCGRTKFKQKTDAILHVCESSEQRTQRSEQN